MNSELQQAVEDLTEFKDLSMHLQSENSDMREELKQAQQEIHTLKQLQFR